MYARSAAPCLGCSRRWRVRTVPLSPSSQWISPLASPELAAAEARLLWKSGADAVVPRNAHGFEPLHAAYRRDTCLPVVRELVAQGSFRARDLLDCVKVRTLSSAEVHAIVPAGGCFANANTPEELERLRSYDVEAALSALIPNESHYCNKTI